jgi:hypothetical protein
MVILVKFLSQMSALILPCVNPASDKPDGTKAKAQDNEQVQVGAFFCLSIFELLKLDL